MHGRKGLWAVIAVLFVCAAVAAVLVAAHWLSPANKRLNNVDRVLASQYDVVSADPERIHYLPDAANSPEGAGFTCTGLAYDATSNTFWAGNYGKLHPQDNEIHPSLVNLSFDFSTVLKEIQLESYDGINVQGVAFDSSNQSIWYADGKSIINIDQTGTRQMSFTLGQYSAYIPNGLTYDASTDTLYVLCYYSYLLHYSKQGTLLDVARCAYADQDQLCSINGANLGFSLGASYRKDDINFCIHDADHLAIKAAYQLRQSYAIEGVFYLDGYLYVLNDGLYHQAKIAKNYVAQYALKDIDVN